jgi:hypothetical protein
LLLQEPQPIDWEYYKKGIGSKVVDMYKQAYESEHPLLQHCFTTSRNALVSPYY